MKNPRDDVMERTCAIMLFLNLNSRLKPWLHRVERWGVVCSVLREGGKHVQSFGLCLFRSWRSLQVDFCVLWMCKPVRQQESWSLRGGTRGRALVFRRMNTALTATERWSIPLLLLPTPPSTDGGGTWSSCTGWRRCGRRPCTTRAGRSTRRSRLRTRGCGPTGRLPCRATGPLSCTPSSSFPRRCWWESMVSPTRSFFFPLFFLFDMFVHDKTLVKGFQLYLLFDQFL